MSQEPISSPKSKKREVNVSPRTQWKDIYQSSIEFKSRLFKLLPTKMLKHVLLGNDSETMADVQHQHFYHTFDSGGREQSTSVAVGGHFHVMTILEDSETGEPVVSCSGPKIYAFKKNKKIMIDLPPFKATDDRGDAIVDKHTHVVVYERTSKIKPRTVSAESVKVIDRLETSRLAPIEGIKG